MKTIAVRAKRSIRGKSKGSSNRPEMPRLTAKMGPFARKLDAAFREVASGQVTIREVVVAQPSEYSAIAVRDVRESMRVSQGVFALLMGVSSETVENWEQGLIAPRPIARRLLDMIAVNPAAYRAKLLKGVEARSTH